MSYRRTIDPTVEPVTLAVAKAHLNVTDTNDDTMISAMISAAREHVEHFTGRSLVAQTWLIITDDFPSWEIRVSKPRLISVTSLKYYDTDNVQQTLVENTDFTIDKYSEPSWIVPSSSGWPTVYSDGINAVELTVVQGYEDSGASPQDLADNVPSAIKQAILLHVGHMYEHRESASDFPVSMVPMAWSSLVQPYKLIGF